MALRGTNDRLLRFVTKDQKMLRRAANPCFIDFLSNRRPKGGQTTKGATMDFIERFFGVSPDGGSGATEAMIVVAVIAMASLIYFRREQRRKSRNI